MNFVEQNTAPFPEKPIPKKLKFDSQGYGPSMIHDLSDADHRTQQIQGLQTQRVQFSFDNLKNGAIKIPTHSMSKEKTYDYIRDNFQHLEESEIQHLYQEIRDIDAGDDKAQECNQQQAHQLKMSDANKLAHRQMQQLQQRGQILGRYQTDYVNSKFSMQNSQQIQKFKLPPKVVNQPAQASTRLAQQRVSKKRGLNKTFQETQQQNSTQLENNQYQAYKNIQMMYVNQPSHQQESKMLSSKAGSTNSIDYLHSSSNQQIMSSTNHDTSSQGDSQQIIESPKSTVENSNQISQQQVQRLKYNLSTAKDRFFTSLENSLEQYMNNRQLAYDFIIKELNTYDDETFVTMNQIMNRSSNQQSTESLQRESNILKSGVRIYNQKYAKLQSHTENMKQSLMQMQTKLQEQELENEKLRQSKKESEQNVPHFQMLKAAYEKQAREMELLRAQNQYLLKNLIPEPHVNNHHPFGGHNGGNFDGSVC